jgi:hypothetical protein
MGRFFVEGLRRATGSDQPRAVEFAPASDDDQVATTQVIKPPFVNSDDLFPAPSIEAAPPHTLESRFELVTARVPAAELALMSVRERLPGIGHNRGLAEFEPLSISSSLCSKSKHRLP